ncbi:hypothetical protein KJ567_05900 [Candidatus Bipolaricaulota bacterium]|nr:hypothetical protein [Candidatus Bipolaricaulota bacterium]
MIRRRCVWMVAGVLLLASLTGLAQGVDITPNVVNGTAIWFFTNAVGVPVTGLQLEFDQEVTITQVFPIGGFGQLAGPPTGQAFIVLGDLAAGGSYWISWQPANAVPTFAIWLSGQAPIGAPFFTTIAKLGYLFGQGIVHLREADPAALGAAFEQFFMDNAEYLAGLAASTGLDLATSLLPIIMASPAEGIENFFNTVVGMLGVTTLEGVLTGGIDFSALFAALGM